MLSSSRQQKPGRGFQTEGRQTLVCLSHIAAAMVVGVAAAAAAAAASFAIDEVSPPETVLLMFFVDVSRFQALLMRPQVLGY